MQCPWISDPTLPQSLESCRLFTERRQGLSQQQRQARIHEVGKGRGSSQLWVPLNHARSTTSSSLSDNMGQHNRGHDDRQRHWRNNIARLGGVASAETERSPGSRSTTHARPAVKAQIFPVRTASKFHHGTCSPLMSEPHSPKLAEAALFLHLFTCRCKHCGRLILPSNADFQFVAQSCSSYILECQWHSDTFLAQGECVLPQLDIAHGSALIYACNQPGILQSAF